LEKINRSHPAIKCTVFHHFNEVLV